jgi:hypothetical protein
MAREAALNLDEWQDFGPAIVIRSAEGERFSRDMPKSAPRRAEALLTRALELAESQATVTVEPDRG